MLEREVETRKQGRAIRAFIRDTLGCGCPDEVLQSIHRRNGVRLSGHGLTYTRLDVGGRLLIFVVRPPLGLPVRAGLHALLRRGFEERERDGFNRFRLVLAAGDDPVLEAEARAAFDALDQRDDRIHLHLVSNGSVPL